MIDWKVLMENGEGTMGWNSDKRIAIYNRKPGGLDGYNCPICNNKGNVMIMQDGYEYFVECECMNMRRSIWRLQKSGLADMVLRYKFDTFDDSKEYQRHIKTMAQEFVKKDSGWFFIGGQSGVGKTHICTAIASEFLRCGRSVRYMIWTDEIPKLKAVKLDEEVYIKAIGELKQPDVLYIDDFFKTRRGSMPTDADVNIGFELINARYNDDKKITIISGERTLKEIMEIDEALGSRIYQRCGEFKISISRDKNKNYRLNEQGWE